MNIYRNLVLACVLAVGLGACAELKNFSDSVSTTYASITSHKTIYDVKNAYAAGDTLVINYRKYCYSQPYAVILVDPIARPVCQNRRSVIRVAQAAKIKASKAIAKAQAFISQNPTLDATTVINAAWSAATAFEYSAPSVPK